MDQIRVSTMLTCQDQKTDVILAGVSIPQQSGNRRYNGVTTCLTGLAAKEKQNNNIKFITYCEKIDAYLAYNIPFFFPWRPLRLRASA
jgi:hypothetical protein